MTFITNLCMISLFLTASMPTHLSQTFVEYRTRRAVAVIGLTKSSPLNTPSRYTAGTNLWSLQLPTFIVGGLDEPTPVVNLSCPSSK